jgi:GntR family transcriptional regulator
VHQPLTSKRLQSTDPSVMPPSSISLAHAQVLKEIQRQAAAPRFPKYAQVRDALLAAIESGYWKPGAKLPTEVELTRHTPYSLGTVQRALRALVDDGVVIRQQGSGTYVAEHRKAMDAPWHCRFLGDDGAILPIYPKVVLRKRITERGPWSEYLQQRGDNVLRIDRNISINDEFLVFSRFYLDANRFAGMFDRPVAELDGANFKAILAREFGLPVTHFAQTVAATRFDDAVCRAIKVRRGTVGMLLQVVASTGRGRHIYYQELFVPPSRRQLQVSDSYESHQSSSGKP